MEDTLVNQNSPSTTTPTPPTDSTSPQAQTDDATQPKSGKEYEKTEATAPEDLDVQWTRWRCGVCNYTYEGSKSLVKCPKCGNDDTEKFIDAD